MKVVIMAGGRGSRISSIASDIPKPMIKIAGMPVLEHELYCLRDQGYVDIIITISYLGQNIVDYFGDGSNISPVTGEPFGVKIEYYNEKQPMGNAGALFRLKDKLTEDFLLLNADSVFDVDFKSLEKFHKKHGGLATLLTHPNDHPYDSGLIFTDKLGCVTRWITKEEDRPLYYKNRVNAGIHIINPQLFKEVDVSLIAAEDLSMGKMIKIDLDRQILKPLAGTGKMFCYDTFEYVKDMGTPERFQAVQNDYRSGIIQRKNRKNKQKAIFLDRDGTINQYVGFIRKTEDFCLLEGAAEAIKKINASEYLAIIVTNQPIIARGEVTYYGLEKIHNKMETLLGREGAYLDGIYFCPHHPHKGYKGEISELKTECACRKPKPGMLLKAAEDFNIDLKQSWMIGDTESDVIAGKQAGCKTILIKESCNGKEDSYTYKSLFMAVARILE